MKIPGLSEDNQNKLDICTNELEIILDKHFPKFRSIYEEKFHDRIFMILYMELIQFGIFRN